MAIHFETNRHMFSEQMRVHAADLHFFADELDWAASKAEEQRRASASLCDFSSAQISYSFSTLVPRFAMETHLWSEWGSEDQDNNLDIGISV